VEVCSEHLSNFRTVSCYVSAIPAINSTRVSNLGLSSVADSTCAWTKEKSSRFSLETAAFWQ